LAVAAAVAVITVAAAEQEVFLLLPVCLFPLALLIQLLLVRVVTELQLTPCEVLMD
jgi:hypothetical protein